MNTKFSIIMLTYNGLQYTVQAVESVFNQQVDCEFIVVDNSSTDGTVAYLRSMAQVHPEMQIIENPENRGVPAALNQGLDRSSGDYILILNNDIVLPKLTISKMFDTLLFGGNQIGLQPLGMVGPKMNFVAGRQETSDAQYFSTDLETFADDFSKKHEGSVSHTGWLCGSCLMFPHKIVDDIGLWDERFSPGGYEDNDFSLRAQLAGYKLLIADDVFVHHWGSKTFHRPEFQQTKWGVRHRDTFYSKYRDDKPKSLFAVYRVKDCAVDLRRSLERTSLFADGIVVWCDNCSDDTAQVAASFDKVVRIVQSDVDFNERRDRNATIAIAKEYNPDWIISIDCDEILEDKFDADYAQKLMHPHNPETLGYGFHFYNFWNSETHWRVDGIFGRMRGFRMFRNLPNQEIVGGTSIGLHCGNIPPIPEENLRWSGVRIKHYAFTSEEKQNVKFDFYQKIDEEKDVAKIGQEDYSHLVSQEFCLNKWKEQNSISFYCLTKNSQEDLRLLLDTIWTVVDQIVVLDNQSADDTVDVAKEYDSDVFTWSEPVDFAAMRNFAKSKCTGDWILTLDPDETVDEQFVANLRKLVEADCDGYLFNVNNYHKQGGFSHTESVRLYKNASEFLYRGLVHENFDQAADENHLKIYMCDFLIHHYGYLRDADDMKEKMKLYKKLNRKQLDANPKDPKAMFNLALHYVNDDRIELAKRLLKKSAKIDENYMHPRLQLSMLALREAQRWLSDGLEKMNSMHRLYPQSEQILRFLNDVIGDEFIKVE